MISLFDIHCHLLPGLDDGPRDDEEAIRMCRVAWEDGTRTIFATCHQGGQWEHISRSQILAATAAFAPKLTKAGIDLAIYPGAELALSLDLPQQLRDGTAMTLADQRKYVLLEFPRGLSLDFREYVADLVAGGVTPILAHPERYSDLREDDRMLESLIQHGCLIQLNASSLLGGLGGDVRACVKRWITRWLVHFVASDGHSPEKRPPKLSQAYRQIESWAGSSVADRLCSLNGLAVVQGRRISSPSPRPAKKRWTRFFLPS